MSQYLKKALPKITLTDLNDENDPVAKALRQLQENDNRATIDRHKLLVLQFTKLVNIFGDQLDDAWGGDYLSHGNARQIRIGLEVFLSDMHNMNGVGWWIRRLDPSQPWERSNVARTVVPSKELGNRYDPYFFFAGKLMPGSNACQYLSLLPKELIDFKVKFLLDNLIVDECIRKMVSPRPTWMISQLARTAAGKQQQYTHPKLVRSEL